MNQEEDEKNAPMKTFSSVDIVNLPSVIPIVDAHMHIQSNDIAPEPIMNGIFRLQIFQKLKRKSKKINYIKLSFREKTQYDYDPKTGEIYYNNKKVSTGLAITIDESNFKRKFLTNATAIITDYGKIARQCSYTIAGIYKNDPMEKTSLGYPSRRIYLTPEEKYNDEKNKKKIDRERNNASNSLGERKNILKKRDFSIFVDTFAWYNHKTSLLHNFPFESKPMIACPMGMELFYAHYWGAYGIPVYFLVNNIIYTIDNFPTVKVNYEEKNKLIEKNVKLNFPYDMEMNYRPDTNDFILKNKPKECRFNTKHIYSIFLKEISNRELVCYETHDTHVLYQKMAALKYPLSFFPFYHFDPRRFFSPYKDVMENFSFYIPIGKNNYKLISNNELSFTQDNTINRDYVTKGFSYAQDIQSLWKKELIDGDGVFWGIKLYVALGYPPYIGVSPENSSIYPLLKEKDYSQFITFLNNCGERNIPITCHGSPQGMTIADSEIYLKEYLKQAEKKWTNRKFSDFEPTAKGMMLGLGLIDDFSSPSSWEIVLGKLDASITLTLCLAHFGGKPFFIGEYEMGKDSEKNPYSWQEDVVRVIEESRHNIYTDLSNFMFDKVSFPSYIDSNKYSLLADDIKRYFSFDYDDIYHCSIELNKIELLDENTRTIALKIRFAMLEAEIVGKDINIAATKLSELIKNKKRMRYRIMHGTDYPMFETQVHGIGTYTSSSFIFYQLLTHKLNEGWDAWHQFCVINPLRFLGLLIDENGNSCTDKAFNLDSSYFTINLIKIDKMVTNLKKLDNKIINPEREAVWGLNSSIRIEHDMKEIVKKYGKMKIPNSNYIIDSDNKLIITGGI